MIAIVAGATTLLTSALAVVDVARRSPSLHTSLETAIAVISVAAAHLVHGRFRESSARTDLLLFYSLAVFAITNLLFAALPAAVATTYPDGIATWAPTLGALVGAGLLLASALASDRPAAAHLAARVDRLGGALVTVVAVGAIILLAEAGRPIGPGFNPSRWGWDDLGVHPEVGLQVLISALFLAAGFTFASRAQRHTSDRLLGWIAAGSVLAAFARVNYFIFPSLYSNWVYTGDALRMFFYLLLFVGAAREIRGYQRLAADAAVLEERRRIARDLHDGLAQELAYITAQTKKLARMTAASVDDRRQVDHLARAAERALDESRRAIAALAQPVAQPLATALAEEAMMVAARADATVELDLAPDVEVEPVAREMLLRIVREGVANAARHGGAGKILVQLSNGSGLHLRIVDDGVGFDSAEAAKEGRFGLTSMRDRARSIGGEFHLKTRPGGGTEIEVVLP
ncbi:MAG TPA: sensor histidine kinase [Gaiellaceae bacterium]|nr:sensor histidine kinase [Gaiellaceae bacterium]